MKKKILLLFILCILSFVQLKGYAQEKYNLTNRELQLNNGTTVKISDFKGKVVLLDFWYRGCFPCLQATPELIKLQKEYKDQLVIIGINDRDDAEDITAYYTYKGANYLSTFKTDHDISKHLTITSFPTFIIFDTDGKPVNVITGFDKKMLRKELKKYTK